MTDLSYHATYERALRDEPRAVEYLPIGATCMAGAAGYCTVIGHRIHQAYVLRPHDPDLVGQTVEYSRVYRDQERRWYPA